MTLSKPKRDPYTLKEYFEKENSFLEGNDGEAEFDNKMIMAAQDKDVLDIGCGDGAFTIEIGKKARTAIGIDISNGAIKLAKEKLVLSKIDNMEFQIGDANNLRFNQEKFDLVLSRRGPATENIKTLSEVHRVLKNGGKLMEINIGEQDKINLKHIFGRGQGYRLDDTVANISRKMLEQVGFEVLEMKEYLAYDVFRTMKDLLHRIKTTPLIEDFDEKADKKYLDLIEKKLLTEKGIRTEAHRISSIAQKRENAHK